VPAVTDISVGETVNVRYAKWGGGRHYEFSMSWLAEDEHGVWLGAPAGTTIRRPGAEFPASTEWVTCFARAAIVTLAQSITAAVFDAVAAGDERFRSAGHTWLADYVEALTTDR
jgi:hypothetical protein